MNTPRSLFITRHGERADFIDKSWTSDRPTDPPLSDNGLLQAKALGKWMKENGYQFSTILCSPFVRCVQTANEIAEIFDINIKIETGVHEWYGSIVADESHLPYTATELKSKFPRVDDTYTSDFSVRLGLEDEVELHKRFHEVAKNIHAKWFSEDKGNVLVVTHAACVIALSRAMLSLEIESHKIHDHYLPKSTGRIPINSGVCSFTRLDYMGESEWILKDNGRKEHLDGHNVYEWGFTSDL